MVGINYIQPHDSEVQVPQADDDAELNLTFLLQYYSR